MTPESKKFWGWVGKLAMVAVPAIITGFASYMQSKAEGTTRSEASYTTLRTAVEELRKDADEQNNHIFALEGEVSVLKDLLAQARAESKMVTGVQPLLPLHPPKLTDTDGIPDRPPRIKHRPLADDASLPADFNEVVQQYKSKK